MLRLISLFSPLASCRRRGPLASLAGALVPVWALVLSGCFSTTPGTRSSPSSPVLEIPQANAEKVLATINGRPLTRGEYFRGIAAKFGAKSLQSEIIGEELFLQAAEQDGIALTEEEALDAARKFVDGLAKERGGEESLAAEYEARGLTLEDLERDLAPRMRTDLLMRKVTKQMRVIDDAMLRDYYEKTHKNKRYVTRHIAYGFISSNPQPGGKVDGGLELQALQRARRAVERIRQGADFATLARGESDDKMTSTFGGALGPISESTPLPAEFKEVIFALKPGDVSEPIENPQAPGFHVFQVTEILPGESYVDCAEEMRKELREREPNPEDVARALKRLRERAVIRWMD